MSSRFMAAKITLTSALVFAMLVFPSLSEKTHLSDYYAGKCTSRKGTNFPTTKCHQYLKCDGEGRAYIEYCDPNHKIFNTTSKKCEPDTTPPCQDTNKVTYCKRQQPRPANKTGEIANLGDYELTYNKKFSSLLRTRFLAVVKGNHIFKTKCVSSCKIWVRKTKFGGPELVLDQKNRTWSAEKVEYNVQENYTMDFGTFYYLDIEHVGDGKNTQFKINVTWVDNKTETTIDLLKTDIFLRLPDEESCPKQPFPNVLPNSTLLVRPSSTGTIPLKVTMPHTRSLTLTETSTIAESTTKLSAWSTSSHSSKPSSLASANSETLVIMKSSTTQQYSTSSSTTTAPNTTASPSSSLQELFDETNNYTDQGKQDQDGQQGIPDNLLNTFRDVDRKGEEIAKKWKKRGRNMTVYRENLVMEVHFPNASYTFPRQKFWDQKAQNFIADEIFIPAKALMNGTGGYERKVFSTLYSNNNIQPMFNAVEKNRSQIIRGSFKLNSHVIASTAVPTIKGLPDYYIIIRLGHLEPIVNSNTTRYCAFLKWGSKNNSSRDIWSTEGCLLDEKQSNSNITVCKCNHLTHFGILMQVYPTELSPQDVKALKIITYIGCSLSLIGVCLTVLAIMCLPGARSDRNFIHVNLAVAIAFAQITFLAGIDETEYRIFCTIVAALLHYFLLVAFSWMLMEGIFLHILIVKVFHDHLPRRRFYVTFCWGAPLLIVLLAVNLLGGDYRTETSCWLSAEKSAIWTFSGPAILIIIINIVILCKIMKEINSLRTSDRQDSNVRSIRYGVRSAIILLPLLGLTWAFGLLCVNDSLVVFQYLFTIFNSLQGLFIFLFHCVFNTEVRKAFWRKVDIWFTNHNSPFGNDGQSGSSLKKDKDSPSSTDSPDKGKMFQQTNGLSMYSFNGLTERERRKLSTTTASTCLEVWPHKLSLTPSLDNAPYPNKFTPSSDDIKYQAIYKLDAGQKRISPKTLHVRSEDLNGNTHAPKRDSCLQMEKNELLIDQEIPNGNSVALQDNESRTNVAKNVETEGHKTQSKQQNIAWSSGKDTENSESSEEKFFEQGNLDETVSNQSQQKPPASKKSSFEEEKTVGIGGKPLISRNSTGCVRVIDVNSSSENTETKL